MNASRRKTTPRYSHQRKSLEFIHVFLLSGYSNDVAVYGQIDWNQTAEALHNWIRGNDKVPGAWAEVDGQVTGL